jgi:hypothetical protein
MDFGKKKTGMERKGKEREGVWFLGHSLAFFFVIEFYYRWATSQYSQLA